MYCGTGHTRHEDITDQWQCTASRIVAVGLYVLGLEPSTRNCEVILELVVSMFRWI